MQLTADQELRRELLLFSLSKQPDLRAAIDLAVQMEQFVLRGCSGVDEAAGRLLAAVKGSDAAPPADRAETEGTSRAETSCATQMSGTAGSLAHLNGINVSPRPVPAIHEGTGGKKRRWSSGDDERLRRLWHSNHSLEEIAEAMGRTTPSLYSRARALGMAKRSPVIDKRDATLPARAGREPSSGAGMAPAGEDDKVGESECRSASLALPKRRAEIEVKRHDPQPGGNGKSQARTESVLGGGKEPKRNGSPAGHSFMAPIETSVEPIIHFLRSRDYSVVRVEDGRFRLDGRRILSADELREKANQVRQSLGKPPFTPQSAGSAG